MEQIKPSFKEILVKNQLLNGRLQLSSNDLNKLYHLIIKQNKQTTKKIENHREKINFHISQISTLKLQLKHQAETIQKAFYPQKNNISLIYKKLGNKYYIKARIYWQGQQREVQVGSIKIVMDLLHKIKVTDLLKNSKIQTSVLPTWEEINNNNILKDAIKSIAALKFQEYIIRKIKDGNINSKKINDIDSEKIIVNNDESKLEDSINEISNESDDLTQEKQTDWYIQWRENNLR